MVAATRTGHGQDANQGSSPGRTRGTVPDAGPGLGMAVTIDRLMVAYQ